MARWNRLLWQDPSDGRVQEDGLVKEEKGQGGVVVSSVHLHTKLQDCISTPSLSSSAQPMIRSVVQKNRRQEGVHNVLLSDCSPNQCIITKTGCPRNIQFTLSDYSALNVNGMTPSLRPVQSLKCRNSGCTVEFSRCVTDGDGWCRA